MVATTPVPKNADTRLSVANVGSRPYLVATSWEPLDESRQFLGVHDCSSRLIVINIFNYERYLPSEH